MGLRSVIAFGMTVLLTAVGGAVALSSGTGCIATQIDVVAA